MQNSKQNHMAPLAQMISQVTGTDRHNMSGQAIQLNEHMTEKGTSEYKKRVIHRCEVQNQNHSKLTCTNMVLQTDMHYLDDSTCITSLLCPV